MKFAFKIFASSFIVLLLSLGIGGFGILHLFFEDGLRMQLESQKNMNRYIAETIDIIIANSSEELTESLLQKVSKQFGEQGSAQLSSLVTTQKEKTFEFSEESKIISLQVGEILTQIIKVDKKYVLQIISICLIENQKVYVETLGDVSNVYQLRDMGIVNFQKVLMVITLVGAIVLGAVAVKLTRPVEWLKVGAEHIAKGMYNKRIVKKHQWMEDEMESLVDSFNSMAERVEKAVWELEQGARRKDDFVANVSHELKTPMTAIIGYAQMLRSYDMEEKKRRDCANYIYHEGIRVERLSRQLLELIVLQNNEIVKKACSTKHIEQTIKNAVIFLIDKYQQILLIEMEPRILKVEDTLIITLLYNLIHNACKASESNKVIRIDGKSIQEGYMISVIDQGCGIPEDEVDKIIEPFYMVDKSRSKNQNGTGIGLALCHRIALLHNTKLVFETSRHGTKISFVLEDGNE